MTLSIVVPMLNEERTIATVIQKLEKLSLPHIQIEILIVDDGSTDSSYEIVKKIVKDKRDISVFRHGRAMGKGAAVRTGVAHATGDYLLIQDADLEYDPKYIPFLLRPIVEEKSKVVYGTRLKRWPHIRSEEKTIQFLMHYFGNRFLSLVASLLYGQWITDIETGYKVFERKVLAAIQLEAQSFDFEPEVTAKILKRGYKISEVVITTNPRGYKDGKKLRTIPDGLLALWTLIKYRFYD